MPRHPSCARVRLAELMLRPLATLQFSFTSDSTVVKDREMEGAALVGLTGVEPVTSSLSGTRSNQLSYKPGWSGGGSRTRTGDIQLAKLALYRLSYAPRAWGGRGLREGLTSGAQAPRAARRPLRKEVIQPLVPQRLPCYDFIPITTHTLGRQTPDFGCRRLS